KGLALPKWLRWLALLPVLLSTIAVTGCGSSGPMPTVAGGFGADPLIAIPAGRPSGDLQVQTVIKGHGPVVRPDDFVITNVEAKVWAGDRMVIDTYTNRQPQGIPLSVGMPTWRHLAGQQVGSRVLMVVPPREGFGPKGNTQLNIMGGDTLVLVFDILRAFPRQAGGSSSPVTYRPGPGLPTVTSKRDGPVITAPKTAPPKHLVVKMLRRGIGPRILGGQTVAAQYTGAVWRTGKVFDSSWKRGFPQSFVLGHGQMIPGWDQGLGGLPVGSRVLLVVPPALAYGRSAQPPYIDSGDTLVFVVDIIAAVQG
ncbi:MAG: FKBP-type peptidyl-prolyl cis-trans isomerase, partial [Micromonosporaceae bacterium]